MSEAVKGAFASKINLTQVVAILAMIVTHFGWELGLQEQAAIVSAIVAVQGVVTVILRVWFTNSRIQTPPASVVGPK